MKKNLLNSFYLLLANISITSIHAQEYERAWGTYFGPAGTTINGTYRNLGLYSTHKKICHCGDLSLTI